MPPCLHRRRGCNSRAQMKDEEWRGVRRDMNRIWKDVYERNYLKSLDHRSFYFKQIDKRNLSSKGLVSEMRSLVEVGTPAVILFPCADVSLHKDVYDLIMMIADSDSRSLMLCHSAIGSL